MSGKRTLRTDARTVAPEMEQVAVDEAQSFIRQVEWRVLVAIAALIAHEATIFAWKRMTGQPPPVRRGRSNRL